MYLALLLGRYTHLLTGYRTEQLSLLHFYFDEALQLQGEFVLVEAGIFALFFEQLLHTDVIFTLGTFFSKGQF